MMINTQHLLRLTDDCGLIQHAFFDIQNRRFGYSIDDNARALQLMLTIARIRPLTEAEERAAYNYAAFVHHCWLPDDGQFRNYLGYNRRWIDSRGDEDASARSFRAVAAAYRSPCLPRLEKWARTFLDQMLASAFYGDAPRAWALTLLGLEDCLFVDPEWHAALTLRSSLSQRLMGCMTASSEDWMWWEPYYGYENARLCEAAICTGTAMGNRALTDAGIATFAWLNDRQFKDGLYRSIGTTSFGQRLVEPTRFDQQPIEAAATLEACYAAHQVDGSERWRREAAAAFAWFQGKNDLGLPLAADDGSCRDGLHPDRVNGNAGAESTLCYLAACCAVKLHQETASA